MHHWKWQVGYMRPKHVDVCFFYSPPRPTHLPSWPIQMPEQPLHPPAMAVWRRQWLWQRWRWIQHHLLWYVESWTIFFFLLRERHTFSVICKIQEYILENCMLHLQQGFLLLEDEDFKHITVLLRRLYQSVWVFLQDPQIQNNYWQVENYWRKETSLSRLREILEVKKKID